MSEYNGWDNYETWRINLEMIDGMTPEDFGFRRNEFLDEDRRDDFTIRLADALESHVAEIVEMDAKGFALDLANRFLSRVNWMEIANHMVDDYATEAV